VLAWAMSCMMGRCCSQTCCTKGFHILTLELMNQLFTWSRSNPASYWVTHWHVWACVGIIIRGDSTLSLEEQKLDLQTLWLLDQASYLPTLFGSCHLNTLLHSQPYLNYRKRTVIKTSHDD
jgi:hypothetical protein